MFSLIPRDDVFFKLFCEAAENVHVGAVAIADLLDNYHDIENKLERLKEIERIGDRITRLTIERLNKTFITPIDRDDIGRLISRLDDILDLTFIAADRMVLYKIPQPTKEAQALAYVLVKATKIITRLCAGMNNMKNSAVLLEQCEAIRAEEHEGDRIERHALAALFENGNDPASIIKWKDIYEDLERATDRCEDVANVVQAIVLKNA